MSTTVFRRFWRWFTARNVDPFSDGFEDVAGDAGRTSGT